MHESDGEIQSLKDKKTETNPRTRQTLQEFIIIPGLSIIYIFVYQNFKKTLGEGTSNLNLHRNIFAMYIEKKFLQLS